MIAMSDEVRQFAVAPDDDGIRLDRWFKRNLPQVGFGTVSRWARTGQLRVDGGRAKVDDRLSAGQVLRIPPGGEDTRRKTATRRELTPEEIELAESMVIARTNSAIVLNKPPGLATQGGTKTHRHVDGLLDAYHTDDEPRPRLVHRLDKDTSGVLLIARTPGSAASYSKRFSGRSAKKIYWALVVGVPDVHEGTIDAALAKQPGTGGEKMHVDEEGGQRAVTRYRVVERAGNRAAWVELEPMTGRTHQLRVHMAAIGHPIVGDGKYGGQDAFLTGSISRKMHLHARRLVISQPKLDGGGQLDVTADLPEHFAASMEQMGFDLSLSAAEPLRDEAPERTKAEKKQAARAHFKQVRKSKRGERRNRGATAPTGKLGKKSPSGAKRKGPTKGSPAKGSPKGRG
ncbi:RluA family pseudouridine synthase [Erythrobacter sp. 3-20A1M]|uniref:RluA family pseudouridine synthase n=1 Tax=Erythrobacter sp. 3-20A1M TaxID=2653850 RepID=UPI001BFC9E1A|nr:RluA family pseudouridine synthase [Erythrobacter sp. 3-20A1M]QWC56253.1 RluA family pseudouridine synthase [Erythrobacter sp. 3-20A1M]